MLTDLALDLRAFGLDVHVVASGRQTDAVEVFNNVEIHRVAGLQRASQGLLSRAVSYWQYCVGARAMAKTLLKPGDVAVMKTDPPMLSSIVAPVARRNGARTVNWLQDVFPEIAKVYGVPGASGFAVKALCRFRNRSLSTADAIVVIGERMAQHVRKQVPRSNSKIHVIHNWSDSNEISPIDAHENQLRRSWRLDDRFVVAYCGNLGRVHEFETILEAATLLAREDEVRFVFVGHGAQWQSVQQAAARRRLNNVVFMPHQPRPRLAEALSAADVHLCVLRPEFEGLVHPSKLYGIMASGRPTIFVGDADGESSSILANANAGITVAPGAAKELATAVMKLRDDAGLRSRLGFNARREFLRLYDRGIASRAWEQLLNSLVDECHRHPHGCAHGGR
jgi:glycosyltransferase involved in cell wall biosynthesis